MHVQKYFSTSLASWSSVFKYCWVTIVKWANFGRICCFNPKLVEFSPTTPRTGCDTLTKYLKWTDFILIGCTDNLLTNQNAHIHCMVSVEFYTLQISTGTYTGTRTDTARQSPDSKHHTGKETAHVDRIDISSLKNRMECSASKRFYFILKMNCLG